MTYNTNALARARVRGKMEPMNSLADLQRRLENIVRTGTVEAVDLKDPKAPRVRVRDGELVTGWLPFGTSRAGATRTWSAPTKGEQVVMLSPSGELAAAVVICGLYCAANPAPSSDPNEHITIFGDKTRMTYNDKTGLMVFSGMRDVLIRASGSVTLDTPQVTTTAALTAKGLLTYEAGMSGAGGATANGDFTQSGGSLSSNGVTLDGHTHGGVSGGSDKSGAPTK